MRSHVLILLVFAILSYPLNAIADGSYFYSVTVKEEDVNMDAMGGQQALLVKNENDFTMYLQSSVKGNLSDFSWVLPLPAKPLQVTEAPDDLFTFLNYMTGPRIYIYEIREKDDGWCVSFGGSDSASNGGETVTVGNDDLEDLVKVVDAGVVGDFSYEVISSEEEDALVEWLDKNEYYLPEKAEKIISEYIEDGFLFLAAKVRRDLDSDEKVNSLPAMKIKFPADTKMVFPMKITSLSTQSEVPVLIYAAAKEEVAVLSEETQWNQVQMREDACTSEEYQYQTSDLLAENPNNISLQSRERLSAFGYRDDDGETISGSVKSGSDELGYSYAGSWVYYFRENKLYSSKDEELDFEDYSDETADLIKKMFDDIYVLSRWYTELSAEDMDEDIIFDLKEYDYDTFPDVSRIISVNAEKCDLGGGCRQVPDPFWALMLVLLLAVFRGLRFRKN